MRKLTLLLLLVALAGCSKNTIDKKTAAAMIQDVYNKDHGMLITDIGRLSSSCDEIQSGSLWNHDMTPSKVPQLMALQAASYVTITPDGPGLWKVELTDLGKAHVDGPPDPEKTPGVCKLELVGFYLGTREGVKVTSVVGDENTATAEYSWKWKTTELGQMLRKGGKVYTVLTPDQRKSLTDHNAIFSPGFPIPAPEENDVITGTATFTKNATGWHPSK